MPDRPYQEIFYELRDAVLHPHTPMDTAQLEEGIKQIRGAMMGTLAALERLRNDRMESDKWDRWYNSIPHDIKLKIDMHDFKRLGDSFKQAFQVEE